MRKISRQSEPARSRQGVFHPWLDGAVHLWLFYCPSTPVQAHHQVQRSLHCLLNSELLSAGDPVSSWMNLKPSTSLTTSSPNPSSILPFFHPSGGPSWTPFSLPGVRPVPGCLTWPQPTPWIYLIGQKEEDFRSFFVFLFGGGACVFVCATHKKSHFCLRYVADLHFLSDIDEISIWYFTLFKRKNKVRYKVQAWSLLRFILTGIDRHTCVIANRIIPNRGSFSLDNYL